MNLLITVSITLLLVYRAWSHSSLTPVGIVFAALTALIHGTHPSPLPFTLLCVFFLAGTRVTKVKAALKEGFTTAAGGRSGQSQSQNKGQDQRAKGKSEIKGEKRNHIQVLANSGIASLLCLVQLYHNRTLAHPDPESCVPSIFPPSPSSSSPSTTPSRLPSLLLTGILANYASVAADTFSSELGILALSPPRLITKPWMAVPRGTNGGVTAWGVLAGFLGAGVIGVAGAAVGLGCNALAGEGGRGASGSEWDWRRGSGGVRVGIGGLIAWVLAVAVWGTLGSLLDSLLGALFQASVVETRTGKIVEGEGGGKVLVVGSGSRSGKVAAGDDSGKKGSRRVLVGSDLLSNNQVNLLMAGVMSFGGMAVVASWSGLPRAT